MMKFKLTLLLVAISTAVISNAQTDAKAKSILDKLSTQTKSYSSLKANFSYTLENKQEDINETQSGSIAIKGERYYLQIAGQEVRSDGKNVWTYLKDANEVQISQVDKDNEDQITPSSIFTMYEKGFKHEYVKSTTVNGTNVDLIHIYPTDPDSKPYHTVKLYIRKDKNELMKIEILGKEGDLYTYMIKSFQSNVSLGDDLFVFNKGKYPGVMVNDLR